MALLTHIIKEGKCEGTAYDFVKAGDKLPMHDHTPETLHITIVCDKAIIARGEGWEITLEPGEIRRWKAYQPHEFEAIHDKTRVVNIRV